MSKWSSIETKVISFFASFNKLTDRKYSPKDITEIWGINYPNFPERSYYSISHKLREVQPFNLKDEFINFLVNEKQRRHVLNINDIAIHYNIPVSVASILIDVFEKDIFKVRFYNWATACLPVSTTVDIITGNTKIIHAKEFFEENVPTKVKEDKETFSKLTFKLDDNNDEVDLNKPINAQKDSALERIEEIQFELNDPHTSRSRRKTLKKTLKKYKKQLGFTDIEEEKPDTDTRSEEQKKADEEIANALLERVKAVEDETPTREYVQFKIGVIADTHIGSKSFDPESLEYFYDVCEEEGIDRIIHAGDLFDGETTYVYQNLDQNLPSYKEQFNWIVRNYPKRSGIYTYVISGNHDMNIYKKHNVNPIQEISKVRRDIRYSGDYLTTFNKCGVRIDVVHCDGNSITEPMNKLRTLIHGLDHDCDIYIMGHLHQSMELHDYGRVGYAVLPGCFIKPNAYTIRKGYNPTVGGYILEVTKTGDKVEVISRWVTKQ